VSNFLENIHAYHDNNVNSNIYPKSTISSWIRTLLKLKVNNILLFGQSCLDKNYKLW